MTEITFHFNVADPQDYTCRLLRKAYRNGARVMVTAPAAMLSALDRALWVQEPLEFLPHLRVTADAPQASASLDTPVWLGEAVPDAAPREVLINFGRHSPVGFESFARLIEIVGTDESDRAEARLRWKHYASRGYSILRHEAGA